MLGISNRAIARDFLGVNMQNIECGIFLRIHFLEKLREEREKARTFYLPSP